MLFYILTRLGSICRRTNLQKPKLRKLKSKEQSRTAKAQAPKTRATKAQVEQTETCCVTLRLRVREWDVPCGHAEEVVDFASGRGYSKGQACP